MRIVKPPDSEHVVLMARDHHQSRTTTVRLVGRNARAYLSVETVHHRGLSRVDTAFFGTRHSLLKFAKQMVRILEKKR